jgi:hypothetical protein
MILKLLVPRELLCYISFGIHIMFSENNNGNIDSAWGGVGGGGICGWVVLEDKQRNRKKENLNNVTKEIRSKKTTCTVQTKVVFSAKSLHLYQFYYSIF